MVGRERSLLSVGNGGSLGEPLVVHSSSLIFFVFVHLQKVWGENRMIAVNSINEGISISIGIWDKNRVL